LLRLALLEKIPFHLATLFNSPIYKPLIPIRETEGGEGVYQQLIALGNS
jgi:hypothetical protein